MKIIDSLNNQAPNVYGQYIDYQDTDAGGVVYHGSYINFAERARAKLIRDLLGNNELNKYLWVVANLEAKFILPAKLGDYIVVKTNVKEIKNCSLILTQAIVKEDKLIVLLIIKIVSLNQEFKIVKLSNALKEKLINYMEILANE